VAFYSSADDALLGTREYLVERGVACSRVLGAKHDRYVEIYRGRTRFWIKTKRELAITAEKFWNCPYKPSQQYKEEFELADPKFLQSLYEFIMSKRWK